ncbi:MAG: DUF5610 domain-containing protein [Bdellovibrionota bacterium]
MDRLLEFIPKDQGITSLLTHSEKLGISTSADTLVLNQLIADNDDAGSVDFSFSELYKSLSITEQKVVSALNEILANKLPGGVQSLEPEYADPEFAANNIVSGITAFFGIYEKQNSDLSPEELLNGFMEQARKGVSQGYGEAFSTLKGIGAFDIEGIQAGVEKTKDLIEQKLIEFEAKMRVQLGIDDPKLDNSIATSTRIEVLQEAGASVFSLRA